MQNRSDGQLLFSASDLVNFLGRSHASALDLANLDNPQSFEPDDEETQLLQRLGIAHELAYLERLRSEGRSITEIPADLDLAARVDRTLEAIRRIDRMNADGDLFACHATRVNIALCLIVLKTPNEP